MNKIKIINRPKLVRKQLEDIKKEQKKLEDDIKNACYNLLLYVWDNIADYHIKKGMLNNGEAGLNLRKRYYNINPQIDICVTIQFLNHYDTGDYYDVSFNILLHRKLYGVLPFRETLVKHTLFVYEGLAIDIIKGICELSNLKDIKKDTETTIENLKSIYNIIGRYKR